MRFSRRPRYDTRPTTPEEREAAISAYGEEVREKRTEPSSHWRTDLADSTHDKEPDRFEIGMQSLLRERGGSARVDRSYTPFSRRLAVMESENAVSIAIYGGALLAFVALGSAGSAIADANYGSAKAGRFLEQQGYTKVEHVDTDHLIVFGCGKGDTVKYEMEATAQNGDRVDVLVCKGLFKSATFRDNGLATPDAPVPAVSPSDAAVGFAGFADLPMPSVLNAR